MKDEHRVGLPALDSLRARALDSPSLSLDVRAVKESQADSVRGVFAIVDNFGGTRSYFLRAASGALVGEFRVWEHAANETFHRMLIDLLDYEDPEVAMREAPGRRSVPIERADHSISLDGASVRVRPLVRAVQR